MLILGIDPGSTRIGFGAITTSCGNFSCVECGLIEIESMQHEKQLLVVEKKISQLLKRLHPARVGVERLFLTKNHKTAIHVAETRGVILSIIARMHIPLIEITPSAVKRAVAGDGKATKQGVAFMVEKILSLRSEKRIDDVTDALAIAIAVSGTYPQL